MNGSSYIQILPYSLIVGQEQQKLALELAYIAPRLGGVLISGQRGTGKSTTVRAFSQMMYGCLPVTLPLNATEDRVVGGWKIDELMRGEAKEQEGLLEEANGKLLYVDEINLLEDNIVNIILDVTSTGILVVQREGRRDEKHVSFVLVGTMNPEEGSLRPQLLDRFGLMVSVSAVSNKDERAQIVRRVLEFDEAVSPLKQSQLSLEVIEQGRKQDEEYKKFLKNCCKHLYDVTVPEAIVEKCIALAIKEEFQAQGNRSDYLLALAARACAAREESTEVTNKHIEKVAPLVLQHRRSNQMPWTQEDDQRVTEALTHG
ncbi:MAG TPA: AAA family ATPase [Stenomitos sp.]